MNHKRKNDIRPFGIINTTHYKSIDFRFKQQSKHFRKMDILKTIKCRFIILKVMDLFQTNKS